MNYENNGVTYRQALREMLKVEGMYLPDENPQLSLFDFFDYPPHTYLCKKTLKS